jgi:L-amino acid N-acyltransferase YncA
MIIVRDMVLEDCAAVASIHVRGWQATYRGIMPDSFLDSLTIEQRTERWKNNFARNNSMNLVAEKTGRVMGFGGGGANRSLDVAPHLAHELWALYADPDCWGQGVGAAMLSEFSRRIQAPYLVWVATENLVGRKFYTRMGGQLLSLTKNEEVGGTQVPHVAFEFTKLSCAP